VKKTIFSDQKAAKHDCGRLWAT